jgi:hypothetical protein
MHSLEKKSIFSYFKKFFALKLKVPKISFGTATLKHYRTVNSHPKATAKSSYKD